MSQRISYELAKQLKDCVDCGKESLLGNRASRCKPCQLIRRQEMNKVWQHTYYSKNKERMNIKAVIRQGLRRMTCPIFRTQEKTKYHNRRALIEGNGGKHTTAEWLELVKEYGNKCAWCGSYKKLTRDHIIPLSRGGTNDISNIQPLCGSCNSSKGNSYEPRITITA